MPGIQTVYSQAFRVENVHLQIAKVSYSSSTTGEKTVRSRVPQKRKG